jgi:hypothetical protein
LRYTLNKEAASDVVSLLLQTGFSGRAELGLIGDDNLTLKVSADGSAWATALVADRTTGAVSLPNTPAAARGLVLPQTRALIGAMTAEPRRARTFLIDNLIAALIDAGVWAKLDQFYLLAATDSQAARLNWINPAAAATAVNSPTFTTNRGYAGDGVTSYLIGAAIDGANFAQDSAAIFAWSLTDAATTTGIVGNDGFLNASIRPRTISNNLDSRLNNTTTSSVAVVDSLGLFVLSRGASANYDRYRNAASLGAAAVASTAAAAGNLIALRDFNSYSTRQIAAFGSGGYLAAAEVTALYNALYAYLHDSTVGAV